MGKRFTLNIVLSSLKWHRGGGGFQMWMEMEMIAVWAYETRRRTGRSTRNRIIWGHRENSVNMYRKVVTRYPKKYQQFLFLKSWMQKEQTPRVLFIQFEMKNISSIRQLRRRDVIRHLKSRVLSCKTFFSVIYYDLVQTWATQGQRAKSGCWTNAIRPPIV